MFHHRQRRASVTCSIAACLTVLAGAGDLDAQVSFDVVADLGSIGGEAPLGGVIRGADGALYGVTSEGGGADNCGLVYRLDATGTLAPIHEFSRPDGCRPVGELALGLDGSLYGVTYRGGDTDASLAGGTVYRIAADGTFTVLHRFVSVSPGTLEQLVPSFPYAGLTLAPDGNFYGTLFSGDVFRISPSGAYALVHQFLPPSGAEILIAALVPGTDGYLYDTWPNALFPYGGDVIFRVDPTGDAEVLHTFPYYCHGAPPGTRCMPEGTSPQGELAVGPGSELYGANSRGGPSLSDRGTIVRLTPDRRLAVMREFSPGADATYADGASPTAGLILGSDGFVYGTTAAGGANGNGTIFRMALEGAFTTLHSFETDAGAPTKGRLFEAAPGVLYGTAPGPSGGVVYRLTVTGDLPESLQFRTDENQPVESVLKPSGDGPSRTFALATDGALGVATILDATTGAFRYTPNPGAYGVDGFTVTATDGARESLVVVTVTIQPMNAPVARTAAIWTMANTAVQGLLSRSDVDATRVFFVLTEPAKGTVQLDDFTGRFTYTPNVGAVGIDAFTFRIYDSYTGPFRVSEVGTMYVAIAPRPSP